MQVCCIKPCHNGTIILMVSTHETERLGLWYSPVMERCGVWRLYNWIASAWLVVVEAVEVDLNVLYSSSS